MKLIGAVIDFVLFFVKRWIVKKDDPNNQYQNAKDENAKMVTQSNQDRVNAKLDDLTGRGM